jgi:uncharacterized protein (DUF1499 family)
VPIQNSRLAAAGAALGMLAAILGFGSVGLASTGVVGPAPGFYGYALGGLTGLIAIVVSLLGLRATRPATGLGGRSRAWRGLLSGAAIFATMIVGATAGAGSPRINDITTDPSDPPAFEYTLRDPDTRGRDYSYPAGFAAQQRAAYPDLAPIVLALPPDQAFDAALKALQALDLEVTLSDQARGVIEARATSKLFRFVDDVVIRIRPKDGGSVVDIRSKSRVGQGDMGANAERIRAITARIQSAS